VLELSGGITIYLRVSEDPMHVRKKPFDLPRVSSKPKIQLNVFVVKSLCGSSV
jgi:hypothetical protein